MRSNDLEPYRRRSERIVENDETPPEKKAPTWEECHSYLGSHGHRERMRYHNRQRQKHPWDSETAKYHSTEAAMHGWAANRKADAEKAAAKAHKKLHGADEANYRTGHEVYKSTGGRFSEHRGHKYGKVTHHTASQFHVKWDHDGSETKHRQSDGAESGSAYPTRHNFYRSGSGGVSKMPWSSEHGRHMTAAEHRGQHEDYARKSRMKKDRQERVSRAQQNLASHHHDSISDKHLEAMEHLHHSIMSSKSED